MPRWSASLSPDLIEYEELCWLIQNLPRQLLAAAAADVSFVTRVPHDGLHLPESFEDLLQHTQCGTG
jgi:hypothetical protein